MDKLIFDSSMKALLDTSRGKLSAKAVEALKALGVNPQDKLKPAYPAKQWADCVKVIAADLFPKHEPVQAQRELAIGVVGAFAEGLIGKAMFGVLRLIGSDRSLRRMTQNFRSGSNFIEVTTTRISDKPPITDELVFNDVSDVPGFYLGLVEGGIRYTNGKATDVRLVRSDGTQAVMHLIQPVG